MHHHTHNKFEIQLIKTLRKGKAPSSLLFENIEPWIFFSYPGGAVNALENTSSFYKWLANRLDYGEAVAKYINNQVYIYGDSTRYIRQLKSKLKVLPIVKPKFKCISCLYDYPRLNNEGLCGSCALAEQRADKEYHDSLRLGRGY